MIHILGWLAVGIVGFFLGVNGAYMLISPRAWFQLPRWILKAGHLTEDKYSKGFGAIQVRLTGAMYLGFIGWVIYLSVLGGR
jgi:hypothetical protein